jgi:hypothetical protein
VILPYSGKFNEMMKLGKLLQVVQLYRAATRGIIPLNFQGVPRTSPFKHHQSVIGQVTE